MKKTVRFLPMLLMNIFIFFFTGYQVSSILAADTGIIMPSPSACPTAIITLGNIIPKPVSTISTGERFSLTGNVRIYINPSNTEIVKIGQYLADKLNPATGFGIKVLTTTSPPAKGNIYLTTVGGDPKLGEEGYQLTVTKDLLILTAYKPAGLFRGIQTIRQMLPPAIENTAVQPGPWEIATGKILDYPRFVWRGTMLDVARHFFSVTNVERYIDEMAYYKLNRFHIHLSDDQGWRIAINSWPNLAVFGGSTQVGAITGGYYTQKQYSEIVAYAQARYITVVPEIDMPGHTNAVLASYANLNTKGVAPARYTGIQIGCNSLAINKDITYIFVDNVIKELAGLTPGAYIHIGGEETIMIEGSDYVKFINRVQAIVQSYGKQMIGWEEVSKSELSGTSIVQHWNSSLATTAVKKGAKVIMSPTSKTYLDMKYDYNTPLGQAWAGYIDLPKAYEWDPATELSGVTENNLLGLEAPLWTEFLSTIKDIEYMAFPRLIGIAEIGWSPVEGRNWNEYSIRLGTQGQRLTAMGINFYRSPQVPWN